MRFEQIIKRDDTEYKICVSAHISTYSNSGMIYNIELYQRDKGKRKWLDVPDTLGEWAFRALSMDDRRKHKEENMLRFVTSDEIYQAKLKQWEVYKPQK